MAVLYGLCIACGFGTADFLGGRASRRASTLGVLLVAQFVAVAGALVVTVAVDADPTGDDLLLGIAAGAFNVVGLAFLYQGLAEGRMGVVAPVTAVVGAAVPIVWGISQGERPTATTWVGVALSVVAAGMIAREPDPLDDGDDPRGEPGVAVAPGARAAPGIPADGRRAVGMAVVAGLTLGSSFVCFDATSADAGFWPVCAARIATLALVGSATALLWSRRRPVALPRGPERRMALGAGAFDVAAMALLLAAVRHELAVVVAPIAALAPAFTVVLAWWLLHEHVGPLQRVGLVGALAGLALIAVG